MNSMAAYFAMGIIEGRFTYKKVMSVKKYRVFKDDIDAILIAEGREDLITEF